MRAGKEDTHEAGHWGSVRMVPAVVASHHHRAQLICSQCCISDTGWRCQVLRALLAPMGVKAARIDPDPAPLQGIRTGLLGMKAGTGLSFLAAMCSRLKPCVY